MAYNNKVTVTNLTSTLATGLLKSTTGTGELSIALNSDLPVMTATVGGAVPTPPNNTTTFLRGDGTFAAPVGGSGDITNGGNTTGADITIGPNDNFGLNLETAGVTRLNITGGATTGGATTITNVTANTNTVQNVLTLRANSTGTAAANFGAGLLFQGESSTTDNQNMGSIQSLWTTATDASRTSSLLFSGVNNAGAIGEFARFEGATAPVLKIASAVGTAGTTTFGNAGITHSSVAFTLGNSTQATTIGNSSGTVTLASSGAINISASGTNNIVISNSFNGTSSTAGIVFGNGINYSPTSGTRNFMHNNAGFSPTSGTAEHNQFQLSGTFNQTGGASGITRGLYLNQTLTAVADMRLLEIAANGANTKGIYQTGSTTTNNFVGKTRFGSTTAPSHAVDITGNMRVAGQYASTAFALTDGATIALDWNNGNVQTVTLGGNRTFTFANPLEGGRYAIILQQDATGSRTVTWPTVKWRLGTAPLLTVAANRYDIITLIYANGNYFADVSQPYT